MREKAAAIMKEFVGGERWRTLIEHAVPAVQPELLEAIKKRNAAILSMPAITPPRIALPPPDPTPDLLGELTDNVLAMQGAVVAGLTRVGDHLEVLNSNAAKQVEQASSQATTNKWLIVIGAVTFLVAAATLIVAIVN